MKLFKRILATVCFVGASSLAQAGFTGFLSGPESLEVGEVGSFSFHVAYTPIDVSTFDTAAGRLEFTNGNVIATLFVFEPAGANIAYPGGAAGFPSVFGRATGPARSFDSALPFEYDLNFTAVFASAGSFSLSVGGFYREDVAQQQSASCLADPACVAYYFDDTNRYGGSLGDSMSITVTAVPELSSYAMMLVGLGLIGAIVRRRKVSLV